MKQYQGARSAVRLAAYGNWRSRGACQFADPDLFFPVSESGKGLEQVTEAKAVCAGCEVWRECLAFALRTRQVHGFWGGMTGRERYLAAELSYMARRARRPRNPASATGMTRKGTR